MVVYKNTNISFNIDTFIKSGLIADEFLVLMLLEQRSFRMFEISKILNISERTVYRCMNTLKDRGFVVKKDKMNYESTEKIADII